MLKFDTPTLVTITAPTASGKSYLLNQLIDQGVFSRIVSTTTRERRDGEKEGVDYYFISEGQSRLMEDKDEFFELITFNGTRYGVTHAEMDGKMALAAAPVVILEPQGLQIYKQKCAERSWQVFSIYVHVTENVRLERMLQRVLAEAWASIENSAFIPGSRYSHTFADVMADSAKKRVAKAINEYHRRMIGIADERRWSNTAVWDAIVPGDDTEKAIAMIKQGIEWRNRKNSAPAPYVHS